MVMFADEAAFQVPVSSAGGGGGASAVAVEAAVPAGGAAAGAGAAPVDGAFGAVRDVATNGFPSVVVGCAPATVVPVAVEGVAAGSLALAKALANEAES